MAKAPPEPSVPQLADPIAHNALHEERVAIAARQYAEGERLIAQINQNKDEIVAQLLKLALPGAHMR